MTCTRTLIFAAALAASPLAHQPPAQAAEPLVSLAVYRTPKSRPEFELTTVAIPGYGEVVEEVAYGGRAYRMGLEVEDVILAVNGHRLTSPNAWERALCEATLGSGELVFLFRDARTGRLGKRRTLLYLY